MQEGRIRQYFINNAEVTKEEYIAKEFELGIRYSGVPDTEPCNWSFSVNNGLVRGSIYPYDDFIEDDQ